MDIILACDKVASVSQVGHQVAVELTTNNEGGHHDMNLYLLWRM